MHVEQSANPLHGRADNAELNRLDAESTSSRGPHRAPPLYSAGSAAVGIEDRARDALARLAASRKPSSQFNINKQPVQHYGAAALAQQPVQPPAPAPRPGPSHVGGRPLGVGMPDLPPRPRLAPYAGESPNRPARPGVDFALMGGRRTPGRRPGVIDRAIMNGAPPRPNTGTPRLNTGAPHLNSPVAQARARFVSPQRGANMNRAPRLNAGAPRLNTTRLLPPRPLPRDNLYSTPGAENAPQGSRHIVQSAFVGQLSDFGVR